MKAFLLTLFVLIVQGQIDSFFANNQKGKGTYYGGNDVTGACSIYPLPNFAQSLTRVAMNKVDFESGDKSLACGMCLVISGNGTGSGGNPIIGPINAFVNDLCPECTKGTIDLGISGDGLWDITWKAVSCANGNTPMTYEMVEVNKFYIKMQVANHRQPVRGVNFLMKGGVYAGRRTVDNHFECPTCPWPFDFPLNIEVIGIDGSKVNDTISGWNNLVATPGELKAVLPNYGGGYSGSKMLTTNLIVVLSITILIALLN